MLSFVWTWGGNQVQVHLGSPTSIIPWILAITTVRFYLRWQITESWQEFLDWTADSSRQSMSYFILQSLRTGITAIYCYMCLAIYVVLYDNYCGCFIQSPTNQILITLSFHFWISGVSWRTRNSEMKVKSFVKNPAITSTIETKRIFRNFDKWSK